MELTPKLAEILGIHAGDGYIRKVRNEFEISGDVEEKEYYDNHVIPLFSQVFNLDIKPRHMPTKGTYGFSKSCKKIKETLLEFGFPAGAKGIKFSVPKKIVLGNSLIRRRFLRGVFDTDGCVAFNKKKGKGKFHVYPRVIHSTVSIQFHKGIKELLVQEKYQFNSYSIQPTRGKENRKYIIQICGSAMLIKLFSEIQPKNPLKSSRYEIWQKYGFCPPHLTQKERQKVLKGQTNPYQYYMGP